jgi:hypothetical protein
MIRAFRPKLLRKEPRAGRGRSTWPDPSSSRIGLLGPSTLVSPAAGARILALETVGKLRDPVSTAWCSQLRIAHPGALPW